MNTLTTRTYAHARMHGHMAGRRHGEDLPLGPCNWGCDYTFTYECGLPVRKRLQTIVCSGCRGQPAISANVTRCHIILQLKL